MPGIFSAAAPALCLFAALLASGATFAAARPAVPADLLDDEHFREEVGINDFTTPSIRKIFTQLAELGPIPFDDVRREPGMPPGDDRLGVALNLGVIIADGFLAVQCEHFGEMEGLGKRVLDHAELLGTGTHIKPHSKALLEQASLHQSEKLKEELASTQRDVEKEMADLRDVDIAHLISLGGWVRAFQIGCVTVNQKFSPETARKLARADIIAYYLAQLETLHPKLQGRPQIVATKSDLARLQDLIDIPEERAITKNDVEAWKKLADHLVTTVAKGK